MNETNHFIIVLYCREMQSKYVTLFNNGTIIYLIYIALLLYVTVILSF